MSPARNHELAKAVFEKRQSGKTFKAIADELGLTAERVIFKSEVRHEALKESGFGQLKPHIRRALLSAVGLPSDTSAISPNQIAERLYAGDLKVLGQGTYQATSDWLSANGVSIRVGFFNFHEFDGQWEAVTTHWPDGRKAPWTLGRTYHAFALDPERISLVWETESLEIRIEDLRVGFTRVS